MATRIGRYRLLAQIGKGGMGEVYLAREITSGRRVALKFLFPHLSRNPEFVQRFRQEYRIARELRHRNIVRVHEFGMDQGRYFIAEEFIDGRSLAERLQKTQALTLGETVRIVQQVATALDALHARGVVHRDLKPSNVLIERGGRVVLTDFGIASTARDWQTQTQQSVMGSADYMAPEQAQGNANLTHQADIYALGVMVYRMLTGRTPFPYETPLAVMRAHVYETPLPLRTTDAGKSLPPRVTDTVMAALSKHPEQRPARASDFARRLASGYGKLTRTPAKSGVAKPSRTPSVWIQVVTGVAVLLLALAAVFAFSPSSTQTAADPWEVAYVCGEGAPTLYVQNQDGEREVIYTGRATWMPAWSPDARHLAFSWKTESGNAQVSVLDYQSGEVDPITDEQLGDAWSPAWSPDGTHLTLDMDVEDNVDVYVWNCDGGDHRRLTYHPAQDSDPSWAPTGDQIAFVSDRSGDLEIYVMDGSGRGLQRLTYHEGRDFAPAWSPDGSTLAYECEDTQSRDLEICLMDVESRDTQQLTDNGHHDRQPTWSSDGKYLLFTQEQTDGRWEIWRMRADGSDQRVFIRDRYACTDPTWRPER